MSKSRAVIAVDPHKRLHAVCVVDAQGQVLARRTFANTAGGFRELTAFARTWREREWAVEGARGTGKHLAQRLVARGESVIDVPSRTSSLVRSYSAKSGRKSDDIDAYSVAIAAVHTPTLEHVRVDERAATLRLLAHRREELVSLRTQALCRIHRELLILLPGGASRQLSPTKARRLLASVRPRDEVGKVRKQLVADQLADLVSIDKRIKDINGQITRTVADTQTTLTDLRGVGPVVAAIVLGEVGEVARFPNQHHFASYNGTAPGLWGSGGDARPCVNLRGNRRLNRATHIAAIAQIRYDCDGRRYYQRKLAEGKTKKEALRCLKRRISNAIYHQLVADADRAARSPGGQVGATLSSSAADLIPTASTSDKPHTGLETNATPLVATAS